jgi:hypothetical protein
MPCRGDWSFEVRINGKAIKEHSIDGRKVITAAPNEEFEVAVDYSSFDGLFLVECYIDGQRTGRYFLDPARQTSRGGARGRPVDRQPGRASRDGAAAGAGPGPLPVRLRGDAGRA